MDAPAAMKALTEPWTSEEREAIRAAVVEHGEHNWEAVVEAMAPYRRAPEACSRFWQSAHPVIKGSWAAEEDALLVSLLEAIGDGVKVWSDIAGHVPGRNAKQCRERWVNNLDPTVNKGPWSAEEDAALLAAQKELGNKWSAIAERMPGRPDNAVKNRWYCMLNRTTAAPRTAPTRRAAAAAAAANSAAARMSHGSRGSSRSSSRSRRGESTSARRRASSTTDDTVGDATGGAGGDATAPRRKRKLHRRSRSAPESLSFVLDAMQPDMQPREGAAMAGEELEGDQGDVPRLDAPLAPQPDDIGDSPSAIRKLLSGIEGEVIVDPVEAGTATRAAAVAANIGKPRAQPSFSAMGQSLAALGSLQGGGEAETFWNPSLSMHVTAHMAMQHSHKIQYQGNDESGSDYWSERASSGVGVGSVYGGSDFGSTVETGDDDMDAEMAGSASRSGSFVTYDDDMLESAFALPEDSLLPVADDSGVPADDLMSDGIFSDDGKAQDLIGEPFSLRDAVKADDIVLHNEEDPFDYDGVCAL